MQFTLMRQPSFKETTIGQLFEGGDLVCFTLEDTVRYSEEKKVWGQTAIPAGNYKIIETFSPKFGCLMPLLVGVPNFEAIRIHWGNSADDTDGCIITGTSVPDARHVTASRAAFNLVHNKLREAWARYEDCFISIEDVPEEAAVAARKEETDAV